MKSFFERHFVAFWATAAGVLSFLGSACCGRALWCDESIRIVCQKNYTVAQLLACQHLKDFDSQAPVGYVLLRPFQALFGIEWGALPFAALSSAVIVAVALVLLRRWRDGERPSPLLCAFVALNPMLIWFGGELWFYQMFAAAMAGVFYFLVTWDDPRPPKRRLAAAAGLLACGYLTMALHFCALFPYLLLTGVFSLRRLRRRGFQDAFLMGILLALPVLANLPVFLNAQYAARHIAADSLHWMRLVDRVPGWLADHFVAHYPQLTGASWLGALVSVWGFACLFRTHKPWRAVFALAVLAGFWVFASYSLMREFLMSVARYWTFALAPMLLVTAYGFSDLVARGWWAKALLAVAVVLNVIGTLNVVTLEGRTVPYKFFCRELARSGRPEPLVFDNHYNVRYFTGPDYLKNLANGSYPVIPCYWEQGETVRAEGLRLLREIAPLARLFAVSGDEVERYRAAGCTTTNAIVETRSVFFGLAKALRVFPEPLYAGMSPSCLLAPLESELEAEAERTGKAVFAPGDGWWVRQMPPRAKDQPFVPVLVTADKDGAGVLRAYVPSTLTAKKLALCGLNERNQAVSHSLDLAKRGTWQTFVVKGTGQTPAVFYRPSFR